MRIRFVLPLVATQIRNTVQIQRLTVEVCFIYSNLNVSYPPSNVSCSGASLETTIKVPNALNIILNKEDFSLKYTLLFIRKKFIRK